MNPSTAERLREYVRGGPVAEVRAAVARALPTVDSTTVARAGGRTGHAAQASAARGTAG